MTRPTVVAVAVAALLAATALLSACRAYLPNTSFLHKRAATVSKSTADARHRFDHAVHAKVLAAQGQTCADCHRFDVKIETGEEPLAKDISARALHPGGTTPPPAGRGLPGRAATRSATTTPVAGSPAGR